MQSTHQSSTTQHAHNIQLTIAQPHMSLLKICSDYVSSIRPFWHFVYYAFNRVDAERLAHVGPERCCAEWILRNGGAISLAHRPTAMITNYNALPYAHHSAAPFHLHTIVADDIGLMSIGFDHLRGLRHLRRMVLRRCDHVHDDALSRLWLVSGTLRELEIRRCANIGRGGLMQLGVLKELECLTVADLRLVPQMEELEPVLRAKLPHCVLCFK